MQRTCGVAELPWCAPLAELHVLGDELHSAVRQVVKTHRHRCPAAAFRRVLSERCGHTKLVNLDGHPRDTRNIQRKDSRPPAAGSSKKVCVGPVPAVWEEKDREGGRVLSVTLC